MARQENLEIPTTWLEAGHSFSKFVPDAELIIFCFPFFNSDKPYDYGDSNQIGDDSPVGQSSQVNESKQPNDYGYVDH